MHPCHMVSFDFSYSSGAADVSLGPPLQHEVGCIAAGFLDPFFTIFIAITSFAVRYLEADTQKKVYADSLAILRTASRTIASIPSFSQSREWKFPFLTIAI